MPRIYATVSIYGETWKELEYFLKTSKGKYPTITTFIDAAVREKLERESIEKDTYSQDTSEMNTDTQDKDTSELNQDGGL